MEFLTDIINLILMTFRLAVPIALASIGVSITERAGVINLGVEGIMLLGALGGVLGAHIFSSAAMGILSALFFGLITGGLYAFCVLYYKANQSVIGIGLNALASGLAAVTIKAVWDQEGMSGTVAQLGRFSIPFLSEIPLIGAFFRDQSPFILMTLVLALLSSWILWKSKAGLRLQAIGEHPMAAATAGINVTLYRTCAILAGSALAALGGAYLSIVHSNIFVANMVAGRGFMAIAANILGGWSPVGSLLASLLFACTQALRFQFSSGQIPDQLSQLVPYLITLLVLIAVGRKAKSPASLGKL